MASTPLPSERRDWKNLPAELLDLILYQLVLLRDCIRFSVVCKEWFLIRLRCREKQNRVNPMLFIVPINDKKCRNCNHCNWYGGNLFDIWHKKVYNFQPPTPYKKRCCGSSYGWWAVAETDASITLMNLFSSKTIRLPPIVNLLELYLEYYFTGIGFKPEYHVFKVILSCDPSLNPSNYMVAVIYKVSNKPALFNKIAIFKSGERSWIYVDDFFKRFTDCQFYKGRLYAINLDSQLIAIHYDDHATISWEFVVNTRLDPFLVPYIVEILDGRLLLLRRIYSNRKREKTVYFQVYELQTNPRQRNIGMWKKLDKIGNCALFIGNNQSICVDTSGLSPCQPNSIYYTDDLIEEEGYDGKFVPKDIGIFDFENKTTSRYRGIIDSVLNASAAVWIFPTWP